MQQQIFKNEILRYPRLDTVIMVEEAIQNASQEMNKTKLWHSLPKKTMYQTFLTILDYLEYSGKITTHNSKVIWIWNPKEIERITKENLVIR